ncbi:hypothetical protein Riv7116_4119 [Rivularia sp. PCC 7116]|nr:hypothetical protein [Rivularia sp. PCC 7116]AFY56553.1 hypothetical protein Riv7116_4119 [Rivularia sp. PCC 7116]
MMQDVRFIGLLLSDGEQRVAEVPPVVATAGGLQPPVVLRMA